MTHLLRVLKLITFSTVVVAVHGIQAIGQDRAPCTVTNTSSTHKVILDKDVIGEAQDKEVPPNGAANVTVPWSVFPPSAKKNRHVTFQNPVKGHTGVRPTWNDRKGKVEGLYLKVTGADYKKDYHFTAGKKKGHINADEVVPVDPPIGTQTCCIMCGDEVVCGTIEVPPCCFNPDTQELICSCLLYAAPESCAPCDPCRPSRRRCRFWFW